MDIGFVGLGRMGYSRSKEGEKVSELSRLLWNSAFSLLLMTFAVGCATASSAESNSHVLSGPQLKQTRDWRTQPTPTITITPHAYHYYGPPPPHASVSVRLTYDNKVDAEVDVFNMLSSLGEGGKLSINRLSGKPLVVGEVTFTGEHILDYVDPEIGAMVAGATERFYNMSGGTLLATICTGEPVTATLTYKSGSTISIDSGAVSSGSNCLDTTVPKP